MVSAKALNRDLRRCQGLLLKGVRVLNEEEFIAEIKKLGLTDRLVVKAFRWYYRVVDGQNPKIPKWIKEKMLAVGLIVEREDGLRAVLDPERPNMDFCLKGLALQGFIERVGDVHE